ncbi:MAG: DUF1697 domain-containing protein [Ignavibacteriae bacterium]|nr:DUF1697 domain-containing protein [Ignavibacteriota bacterium]
MRVFIAMLRGINVSGQKRVPMNELKALYEEIQFQNVTTYIQSGNVVFSSEVSDANILSKKIEEKIFKKFGFEVPVIIRTMKEMQAVIKNNPFLKEKNIDTERLYITYLSVTPTKDKLEKTGEYNFAPDRFAIKGKEVYLYCPISYGNSKLNNNFFENKLQVTATTRNWKTTNELLRIAQEDIQL